MRNVVRRSVRALLLDEAGQLLLIRRTKPGLDPYWTVPGGGVEPGDAGLRAALVRELREELGAQACGYRPVFVHMEDHPGGVVVQCFFACRLVSCDEAARTGAEFDDPARGGYDLDRVRLDDIGRLDLKPAVVRDFVLRNPQVLLANATW